MCTFNTGIRFYYWDHYDVGIMDELYLDEQEESWNINDHGGYQKHQLYVTAKYENIKEEILNNSIYTLKLYQYRASSNKAQIYMNSHKAKELRAFEYGIWDREESMHYNFNRGQAMSVNHLLSVILYCDWSLLSKKFSATFRKSTRYESLTEVKKKNGEYANWSRLLRETVEMFGNSADQNVHKLSGPFYCGMSFEMVIPQFNIRLCGPTSTSKLLEVAIRFAGDDGIAIQLNEPDLDLCAFQCSWFSAYPSEEEYLFCGGYERIKIEGIRIIDTCQDLHSYFPALFYFDKMINSNFINHEQDIPKITDEDSIVLKNLIDHKLKDKFENNYPEYINETFDSFVNNKLQIVINLYNIYKFFDNKISDLIIEPEKREIKTQSYLNQFCLRYSKTLNILLFSPQRKHMNDHLIYWDY